jgi:hypothetical protein
MLLLRSKTVFELSLTTYSNIRAINMLLLRSKTVFEHQ